MPLQETDFEAVIGLEIHMQLLTRSKAFAPEAYTYGDAPNSSCSAVTLGHPGTLPVHNKAAVEAAIKLGLATGSDITEYNIYARKNYFYADLPKGYQITQDKTPICTGGSINIRLQDGSRYSVGLIRIHMEEDAGKSMHDQDLYDTLVDFNRAGVPLLELVTQPVIRSAAEAYAFVLEVRKLVRYLGICDGNMEEGSLRCDANISVRPKGQKEFGTKVEVKNMNSSTNVRKAIEYEIDRQIKALIKGEKLRMETRSFNAGNGTTFVMRTKEGADDYRYFPEPDLPPLIVKNDWINRVKSEMPEMPEALVEKMTQKMALSEYDALVITESRQMAEYFLKVCDKTSNYKAAANWVMVHIKGWLNENALEFHDFPVQPDRISALIALIDEDVVSNTAAVQKLFPELIAKPDDSPLAIAERLNIVQVDNSDELLGWIKEAVAKYPEKVVEYKAGKKSLLGLFMGDVMKLSKGKANPKSASQKLTEYLDTL